MRHRVLASFGVVLAATAVFTLTTRGVAGQSAPKTATGKIQKFVLRGRRAAISAQ